MQKVHIRFYWYCLVLFICLSCGHCPSIGIDRRLIVLLNMHAYMQLCGVLWKYHSISLEQLKHTHTYKTRETKDQWQRTVRAKTVTQDLQSIKLYYIHVIVFIHLSDESILMTSFRSTGDIIANTHTQPSLIIPQPIAYFHLRFARILGGARLFYYYYHLFFSSSFAIAQ